MEQTTRTLTTQQFQQFLVNAGAKSAGTPGSYTTKDLAVRITARTATTVTALFTKTGCVC